MKKSRNRPSILTKKIVGIPNTLFENRYRGVVKKEFKNKHGIYALYNSRQGGKIKLYYVGLAHHLSLIKRIQQHLKDKHSRKWNSFSIFFTKKKQYVRDIESIILSIVPKTEGNKQKPRLGQDIKLKKRIKNAMKEIDKQKRVFHDGKVSKKKKKRMKKNKRPNLKNYFENARTLKREHRGKIHKAKLLKSGNIKYEGEIYKTPSAAARAVVKESKPNGWNFWSVKNNKGKWIKLSKLI